VMDCELTAMRANRNINDCLYYAMSKVLYVLDRFT